MWVEQTHQAMSQWCSFIVPFPQMFINLASWHKSNVLCITSSYHSPVPAPTTASSVPPLAPQRSPYIPKLRSSQKSKAFCTGILTAQCLQYNKGISNLLLLFVDFECFGSIIEHRYDLMTRLDVTILFMNWRDVAYCTQLWAHWNLCSPVILSSDALIFQKRKSKQHAVDLFALCLS